MSQTSKSVYSGNCTEGTKLNLISTIMGHWFLNSNLTNAEKIPCPI